MKSENPMIEELAELEHEQWIAWSKNIAGSERISKDRLERWKPLWKKYSKLTEKEKNQDRKWAMYVWRKIARVIQNVMWCPMDKKYVFPNYSDMLLNPKIFWCRCIFGNNHKEVKR